MEERQTKRLLNSNSVIVLVVVALFLGIVIAKLVPRSDSTAPGPASGAGATITSLHNDAVADYEAALKTGRPVYVLFHSLS